MSDFWQTIVGILASVGVGGAIVAALSSWLGKVWAERLMVRETAKYREELERLTKQLERKNYVSKVRFDAEFSVYRELCAVTDEMERAVYWLFPTIDNLPTDEEQQKIIFHERYRKAFEAYQKASKSLGKNNAFISKEIYDLFFSLGELCRMQVNQYTYSLSHNCKNRTDLSDCWERTMTIDTEYKKLQERLREYLKTLDVF